MEFDKSLISGSTSLMVLSLLKDEDMYGYKMVKELEKKSKSIFTLKEGTLYPVLHSLEKEGSISSYFGVGETGRKCKFYGITEDGKVLLESKKKEWGTFSTSLNTVIGVE